VLTVLNTHEILADEGMWRKKGKEFHLLLGKTKQNKEEMKI
jgi:hypothetical protein